MTIHIHAEPLNGTPRRLVVASEGGKELYTSLINTADGWARTCFAREVKKRRRPSDRMATAEELAQWNPITGGPALAELDEDHLADEVLRVAMEVDAKELEKIEGAVEQPNKFRIYTSKELDELEFSEAAIIENAKVEGQPGGVFGGTKTLKTCIEADAAVSVATGTNFLGCDFFRVPRARRVMFMSAESGLKAIQRLARRIAAGRGYELSEIENLLWCPTVPFIGDDRDCVTVRKIIEDNAIEWAVFDPLYMMLNGAEANNLYAQGVQFRRLHDACREAGADFDLLHHTTRSAARLFEPPTLNDAQWSGISEFVGQWCILGRRDKYRAGSGLHELWLELGARGEFQNSWAIDVDEHADASGRPQGWSATVRPAAEAQGSNSGDKARQRDEAAEKKLDADRRAIANVMVKFPAGETKTAIRERVPMSPNRFGVVWATLFDEGTIEESDLTKKGNGKTYPTYKLRADSDV